MLGEEKMSVEQFVQPASETYLQAIRTASSSIHVCMPCVVVSYDKQHQTIVAKPSITGTINGQRAQYPLLLDVPVCFQGGADIAVTFDVKAGDDCLVIFSDSCMDGWYQRGDTQIPYIDRRHDLSDGFAIIGFRPIPRQLDIQDDYAFAVRVKTSSGWKIPFASDADGNAYINGTKVV